MASTRQNYYPVTGSAAAAPNPFDDIEKGATMHEFADALVRQGFVRKVFGLLAVQLAITCVIGAGIFLNPAVKLLAVSQPAILMSIAMVFGSLIYMSVSEKARHQYPLNMVLMGIFTIGEGTLVGIATSAYDTDIVLLAMGITAMVTTALTVYALTTKTDLTGMGPYLYTALLALIGTALVGLVFRTSALNLAVSCAGAALFSMYIVFDVQMLMGGQHKCRLSPDEYVFAAINIYLDIINLFIYILRILNSGRDN